MKINVLDHGSVEFIEMWGSDERVVEAARMSTGKGFQGWGRGIQCEYCGSLEEGSVCGATDTGQHKMGPYGPPGDEKLLASLYNHKHMTPFEMAGMVIEVKAPLFVFREWHRHRTQSYNELSARYTPLPNENYMPSAADIAQRVALALGSTNRQASGTDVEAMRALTTGVINQWRWDLDVVYARAQAVYEHGLKIGIPKELARLPVPVARYSRMRASAVLRNWLAFLTLRKAPQAQYEIRVFADAVGTLIEQKFPRTWELFAKEQEYGK
jgi:thymidylate synthase (FAD)